MKRIITFIENIFNDWSIMKKLVFLYVFCVIVPLIVTDSVILSLLIKGQERERQLEYDNITAAIQMEMEYAVNEASQVINNIYLKRDIYDFIDRPFENAYDYYEHTLNIYKTVPIDMLYSSNISNVVIYADNPSIINGGHFSRLERAKPYAWYEKLLESEDQMILDYHYVGDREPWSTAKRRVSLVRFMNYEKSSEREKIICVDLDYSKLAKRIINLNYGHPIYVCRDGRVLITNDGHYASDQQYQILEKDETYAATRTFSLLKEDYQVIFMQSGDSITDILMKNRWILFFLLSFNLILPLGMSVIINQSFSKRLTELSQTFDDAGAESLRQIETARGGDEIGKLMKNYNHMAKRMNDLIKTVYKDRIEKQEIDLARQKAELLALHAQINPHFLFNILENIRMSSLLRGEKETAALIEKLAVLERQTVSWKRDKVTIEEEIYFIKAYLELQKHRFGDRFVYEIEVEDAVKTLHVPKLTLVTFVENSCVHGIEKKSSPSWLWIRVYENGEQVIMEIEDTGNGMEETQKALLQRQIRDSSIESVKGSEHIGIINACLRLKMASMGNAVFEIDSEEGAGTIFTIKVPRKYLK